MADITSLFKATVKAVKLREQTVRQIHNSGDTPENKANEVKMTANEHSSYKSEFSTQAAAVVANIRKLQEFLLKYRKDYINSSGQLSWDLCSLTDAERDQIDQDAEVFIKTCAEAVRQLKSQANSSKVLRQVKEHKDIVLSIIDKYLFAVCQLYSEQKAVRVKRVVDTKRLSRLERDSMSHKKENDSSPQHSLTNPSNKDAELKDIKSKNSSTDNKPKKQTFLFDDDGDDLEPMSAEEEKMLQMENEQMFEEMSGMIDEVRQIEGKLVEISRLQEIFADKVLQQHQWTYAHSESDINKVADLVIGSTENIKDGNEEIREAMKNNASFRIWILFFLIMCSLSLLFLDWYNA